MSKRSRIILLIILVLPVLFFLTLQFGGKNKYKDLPHLGIPEGITEKGDTVWHTLPPFSFTDQNGNSFGSTQLKGKIFVAEFFFTRCPTICPIMMENLKKVIEDYPKSKELEIISVSVDPKHDTSQVLKAYAVKNKVTDPRWHFLTGNKDEIYELMNTKGFALLKPEPSENLAQFNHTGTLSLIDKEGHIRGQYDGTKVDEIDKLNGDIQTLIVKYAKDRTNK